MDFDGLSEGVFDLSGLTWVALDAPADTNGDGIRDQLDTQVTGLNMRGTALLGPTAVRLGVPPSLGHGATGPGIDGGKQLLRYVPRNRHAERVWGHDHHPQHGAVAPARGCGAGCRRMGRSTTTRSRPPCRWFDATGFRWADLLAVTLLPTYGLDFGNRPEGNQPPTVALTNTVGTLPEATNTGTAVRVAGIVVTDDGQGTNTLSLSGADAALFEITADSLYLRAGTTLNHTANPVLDVTVEVDDPTVGTTPDDTAALAITVTASPWLIVTSFVPTSTGFTPQFNKEINSSVLNLHDQGDLLGPADVTVVGATTGAVRGSLVVDSGLRQVTFIATGGVLTPDTYIVTLKSGVSAFQDTAGQLLDGDGNGTAGDDCVHAMLVATPPADRITVSLPDFARGYGQPVNLPASDLTAGLPLTVSNGFGISGLDLHFAVRSGDAEHPELHAQQQRGGPRRASRVDVPLGRESHFDHQQSRWFRGGVWEPDRRLVHGARAGQRSLRRQTHSGHHGTACLRRCGGPCGDPLRGR